MLSEMVTRTTQIESDSWSDSSGELNLVGFVIQRVSKFLSRVFRLISLQSQETELLVAVSARTPTFQIAPESVQQLHLVT